MALFKYRAKNKKGQTIEGLIEAPDKKMAAETLLNRDLFLVYLREKKKSSFWEKFRLFSKVKTKDIVLFARQLSVMISATVPVVRSLRILAKQTKNPSFRKIIIEIADDVDGGEKLSDSLAKYPHIFNNFFVSMVKTGETTGQLDSALAYLADQKERDYELKSKIKGMTVYPIFVITALIIVGIIAMVFVLPNLLEVVKETKAELPLATKILIWTSDTLVHWGWVFLLIIIALIIFLVYYNKTKEGKYRLDLFKLKMPILGGLFQRIYLVRVTRSMATLVDGGVPLVYALAVISEVVGNEVYRNLLLRAKKRVEDGHLLSDVFLESKVVPAMLSQTIYIGEESGRLSEVLKKISAFYSREIERTLNTLISLMEPIVIVILGIGVGIMVAAIILPMYNLASSM